MRRCQRQDVQRHVDGNFRVPHDRLHPPILLLQRGATSQHTAHRQRHHQTVKINFRKKKKWKLGDWDTGDDLGEEVVSQMQLLSWDKGGGSANASTSVNSYIVRTSYGYCLFFSIHPTYYGRNHPLSREGVGQRQNWTRLSFLKIQKKREKERGVQAVVGSGVRVVLLLSTMKESRSNELKNKKERVSTGLSVKNGNTRGRGRGRG